MIKEYCHLIEWEHFHLKLMNQNFPIYEFYPGDQCTSRYAAKSVQTTQCTSKLCCKKWWSSLQSNIHAPNFRGYGWDSKGTIEWVHNPFPTIRMIYFSILYLTKMITNLVANERRAMMIIRRTHENIKSLPPLQNDNFSKCAIWGTG